MIGAEVNRRDGWRESERNEQEPRVEGHCRSRRERSNSDRKFLYGVQRAAHSQLGARNRLVFANRARPTSRAEHPAPRRYFEGRVVPILRYAFEISVSGFLRLLRRRTHKAP